MEALAHKKSMVIITISRPLSCWFSAFSWMSRNNLKGRFMTAISEMRKPRLR